MISSKYWYLITYGILIVTAIYIWLSRIPDNGKTQVGFSVPQKGFQAPDIKLYNLADELIALSDLRGNVVVLNLWASWCLPCRSEMPALQAIYDEYIQRDVEILAINITNQDNLDNVLAFVKEFNLTFPILLDVDGNASQAYLLNSLPTTFFINKRGFISDIVVGGPISETLLRVQVEKLIQE